MWSQRKMREEKNEKKNRSVKFIFDTLSTIRKQPTRL